MDGAPGWLPYVNTTLLALVIVLKVLIYREVLRYLRRSQEYLDISKEYQRLAKGQRQDVNATLHKVEQAVAEVQSASASESGERLRTLPPESPGGK
jgi:siroheme synthase